MSSSASKGQATRCSVGEIQRHRRAENEASKKRLHRLSLGLNFSECWGCKALWLVQHENQPQRITGSVMAIRDRAWS